mmetsp:Transcript_3969/g.6430  ORF Transcript_3969/g.6430 Transcript_3969/m.6430 type:complete len:484 (-) Transcript_3969:353-1804(-)
MAQVVVRNTFLHFSNCSLMSFEDENPKSKRSSSLPRQWKPNEFSTWSFSDSFSSSGDGSRSLTLIDHALGSSASRRRIQRRTTESMDHIFSTSEGTQSSTLTDDFLSAYESCSSTLVDFDDTDCEGTAADEEAEDQAIRSSFSLACCGKTPTSSYTNSFRLSRRLQTVMQCNSFGLEQDDRSERGEDSTPSRHLMSYCRTPTGSCSWNFAKQIVLPDECVECSTAVAVEPQTNFYGRTPTGSYSCSFPEARQLRPNSLAEDKERSKEPSSTSSSSQCSSQRSFEPLQEVDTLGVITSCLRTKLTSEASSFQPLRPTDTKMNAVVSAAQLVLIACVPPQSLRLEQEGTTTSISIDLNEGPAATLPPHEILQLASQALESVVARVGSTILSSRIRKQARGYNLQTVVACWPQGCEEGMCWDLLTKGSCPRRGRCRWHHPQPENTMRINVIMNQRQGKHHAKNTYEQVQAGSASERHKIRLTELVH